MNRPGSGDIPPDASVRAVDLAALDIEMTGLRAGRGDRVIEVAVARGRYGAAPEVWSTLINPGRPIRTSEIHGITAAMVAGAPGFAAIRPNLDRWLDGAVLVAHHAHMDLSFLQTEYRRCDHSFLDRPTIDTLGLARNLPGLDSRTLTSLCARFGIDHTDAHRAAGDARATWALSTRLLDTLDPAHDLTVAGAVALGQRRRPVDRMELPDQLRDLIGGPPIWIEYRAAEGPVTRRAIRIHGISSRRIEAWCCLRDAERVFRLDRVRLLTQQEIQQEIQQALDGGNPAG